MLNFVIFDQYYERFLRSVSCELSKGKKRV
jgi:hypothetical protein